MLDDHTIVALLASGRLTYDAASGNVYSATSNTPGRPLGAKTRKGYLRTVLNFNGVPRSVMVHRIACVAAHGPAPSRHHQVNHKSGVKGDNSAENIEWSTPMENAIHAATGGLLAPVRHEQHYNARLSAEDVAEIRSLARMGVRTAVMVERFSVSASHIRRIVCGLRWVSGVQAHRSKHSTGRLLDGRTWDEMPDP